MTLTAAQTDTSIANVIQLSARRARNSGLWAALASQVSTSAAGSGLAGPSRPGQPISNVIGMFDYRPERAVPLDAVLVPEAPVPAA